MFTETTVLIILSRVLEFLGIITTFFLMFKGYKLKYVLIVGGAVVLSIMVSLSGLLVREYFLYLVVADLILTLLIIASVVAYVSKNPEKAKDFTPPEEARCPFCNVKITNEDELCTMKVGGFTLFFDNCHHLIKAMEEVDFLLENRRIPTGEVKEVFIRAVDTGRWLGTEKVKIVEEEGIYRAYENPPEGKDSIDLKQLLENFQNKLRRGKS